MAKETKPESKSSKTGNNVEFFDTILREQDFVQLEVHPEYSTFTPNFTSLFNIVREADERLSIGHYSGRELQPRYTTHLGQLYYGVLATKRIFDIQASKGMHDRDADMFINHMNRYYPDSALPVDPLVAPWMQAIGTSQPSQGIFKEVIPKLPSMDELRLPTSRWQSVPIVYMDRLPSFSGMRRAISGMDVPRDQAMRRTFFPEQNLWEYRTNTPDANIGSYTNENNMVRFQNITCGLFPRVPINATAADQYARDRFKVRMPELANNMTLNSYMEMLGLNGDANWMSTLVHIMTQRAKYLKTPTTMDQIPKNLGTGKILTKGSLPNDIHAVIARCEDDERKVALNLAMQNLSISKRVTSAKPETSSPIPDAPDEDDIQSVIDNRRNEGHLFHRVLNYYSSDDAGHVAAWKFYHANHTVHALMREDDTPPALTKSALVNIPNHESTLEQILELTIDDGQAQTQMRKGEFFSLPVLRKTGKVDLSHGYKFATSDNRYISERAERD